MQSPLALRGSLLRSVGCVARCDASVRRKTPSLDRVHDGHRQYLRGI
jgi:hypothetical protein